VIAAADDTRVFLEPGGGFVYPERCIAAQLDLAVRAGARIEQAAVSSVSQQGSTVVIETADGIIEAGQAVVAAGKLDGPAHGSAFR
jgi:sarcosine oxidase